MCGCTFSCYVFSSPLSCSRLSTIYSPFINHYKNSERTQKKAASNNSRQIMIDIDKQKIKSYTNKHTETDRETCMTFYHKYEHWCNWIFGDKYYFEREKKTNENWCMCFFTCTTVECTNTDCALHKRTHAHKMQFIIYFSITNQQQPLPPSSSSLYHHSPNDIECVC